jgi:two-component system sensor histidine kinase QseC
LKPRSIRAVLLGGSMAVLLAVLGAAAWIGYAGSEDEAEELFDSRLATSTRVLAALYATQPPGAADAPIVVAYPGPLDEARHDQPSPLGHQYETKIAFQVLDAQGRILMRSGSAPERPYAPLEPGFSTQAGWRVFTLRAGDVWVQAAERDDVRGELSEKLALAAVTPLIIGIPLLLLLIALLMRYGLAPLAELARSLERRQPGTLGRIELTRSPSEIAPVVEALNGLLERERRFTADAAHELRTPLSALKVHAQNAARAASEDERQASLGRMLAGLERSIRLAEQMLALSRASAGAGAPEPVSLRQALEDAIEDLLPALKERGMKVSMAAEPAVGEFVVRGDRDKLTTLARNLLDNAVRYSPRGSSVRAELASRDGATTLAISDDGPGIAPELRERVFESYYRVPGSGAEGSGLGLAIVREIATQHGATVEIRDHDGGRGTRVVVTFPGRPGAA